MVKKTSPEELLLSSRLGLVSLLASGRGAVARARADGPSRSSTILFG